MVHLLVLLSLLNGPPAQPQAPRELWRVSADFGDLRATFVSPSGNHHAVVLRTDAGDLLYVDGKKVAARDEIEQVSLPDDAYLR